MAKGDAQLGPEFDHLSLAVTLEQPYLVDVGFGDCFRAPMPLAKAVQSDVSGRYRLVQDESPAELVLEHAAQKHWRPLYRVSREPRLLSSFAGMNAWQQTSPDSPFTGHAVFTLARPWGASPSPTGTSSRRGRAASTGNVSRQVSSSGGCDVCTAYAGGWGRAPTRWRPRQSP